MTIQNPHTPDHKDAEVIAFKEIQAKWSQGLVKLVETLPRMRFPGAAVQPGDTIA